jgi:hypothetical protein
MIYIRKQIVTKTVSEDDLHDEEVIIDLLNNIRKASTDITIEYRDAKNDHIKRYDKVRIKKVEEHSIDIIIFFKSASSNEKGIDIDDIVSIILTTSKHNIVAGKDKISKHAFLDIEQ